MWFYGKMPLTAYMGGRSFAATPFRTIVKMCEVSIGHEARPIVSRAVPCKGPPHLASEKRCLVMQEAIPYGKRQDIEKALSEVIMGYTAE